MVTTDFVRNRKGQTPRYRQRKDRHTRQMLTTWSKMAARLEQMKKLYSPSYKKIIRHNFQLYYVSLPPANAWGELSRMNLLGVSHCECMCANVLATLAQNGYRVSSDAIEKQSSKTPHVYVAYQQLFLLMKHFVILIDSEHRKIVIFSHRDSNSIVS